MADLSDVENVLQGLIAAALYPNGITARSVITAGVKVFRGWPLADQLDADMAAGLCNVSIYAQPGVETNTTRYPRDDIVQAPPAHTLTATVAGNTITIGGNTATPQNVIVLCGRAAVFSYQASKGDSLASVASGLAAAIASRFQGTTASGLTVTVAGQPGIITARVAGFGTVWTEQGRQNRGIQITCWCPTPALRDALAPAVDVPLRALDFITMPDQGAARLRYERSHESDEAQKVRIYRRDLFYMVEYATATVTQAPEVGTIAAGIAGGVSPDGAFDDLPAPVTVNI